MFKVIETPQGPLELKTSGRAGNATIVFVHGIQGTASAFDAVVARLPDGISAIAPNLRGRGGSITPPDISQYTIAHFSGDLAAILASMAAPVWLCGWSMGVLVTLDYLARFGQNNIAGLILASGTACPGDDTLWFRGENAEAIAQEAEARASRLALIEYATPVAVAGAWLSARRTDLRAGLADIQCPALILHGAQDDQCLPHHGEALARGIPGAQFELWPGGHNLMADDPARFAGRVAAFCR